MRKKIELSEAVNQLRQQFNLDVESPFILKINKSKCTFDCLIRGYGAEKGMVVERHYSNIRLVEDELIELGYGYSCFDLRDGLKYINEALADWGKV